MTWTSANLIIQIVAGLLGANIAAAAAREHRFGLFWAQPCRPGCRRVERAVSPDLCSHGCNRQREVNVPTNAEIFAIQSLTGAVVGGIAMLAAGFVLRERSRGN